MAAGVTGERTCRRTEPVGNGGGHPRDHPASATAGDTVSTLVVAGERTVRLVARGGSNTDRLLSRVAAGIGAAVDAVEAFWESSGRVKSPSWQPVRSGSLSPQPAPGPGRNGLISRRSPLPTGLTPITGSRSASASCSRPAPPR
ncbi:hypothetical protein I552_0254 [Mycobacterium xenopi 3993]|nr:hypothetical protein I552_0254 [Mycobacterium xenopi 3993]